jgi:hypothetical protein
MCQKPEVADADESRRQHVQQESAQEFIDGERHQTFFVFVGGIAPAKRNHAVGKCHKSMI